MHFPSLPVNLKTTSVGKNPVIMPIFTKRLLLVEISKVEIRFMCCDRLILGRPTSISSTNSSSSATHIGSSSSISRNTDISSETYDYDQNETSTPTSAPGDNDNDLKRTSKAVR